MFCCTCQFSKAEFLMFCSSIWARTSSIKTFFGCCTCFLHDTVSHEKNIFIFIPIITRCSNIVLIFTLNFCDNFSLSTLMVSWINLHSSLPHRTQPISGHWNIWEGCFESFSTEEPFTSNLVLVDLLLLLLLS